MENKIEKLKETVNKIFLNDIKDYIFIYTPPKVGSTTLVSSLRVSLGKSYNVIHIHDDIMLNVLTGINDVTVNEIIEFLGFQGKNVYVIDVYRSPIERKMSEFFEKISPYHFNNSEENINNYSIKRVTNRFNKIFPYLALGDHYFDKYLLSDPIPFDFNKKYTIQQVNNIKYIKLRLCDSHSWNTILSQIFKADIVLISDYQTDNKGISDLYRKFKKEYKIPINFFNLIRSCKFFNFYYSEDERKKYLTIWINKIAEKFIYYTEEEYNFYVTIYLENQYINDIQINHYIDNGCFCKLCCSKRKELFFKAKNGEKNFEPIIHNDVVNKEFDNRRNHIIQAVNKQIHKKFIPNQFSINALNKEKKGIDKRSRF